MNEDTLKELQSILSKFKIDDLKNYALKDFPELNWVKIIQMIEKCHQKLDSKNVASVIIFYVIRMQLSESEINDIIKTLKLRAFGLSAKRTWFAYKLIDKIPNFTNVPFINIAECIGRSVRAKAIAIRGPYDFDSVLVSLTPRTRSTVLYLTNNYLFISPQTHNIEMLKKIAKAIGWNSIKNCKLSGHHVPSLLMVLNKRNGATHLDAVKSIAVYQPKPTRTKNGLDFTTGEPMKNYLQKLLGNEENAPCLQTLTLQTLAPFRNNHQIFTKAVLSSSNVENSLRDMAMADIVTPSSLFFSMLTQHCKNDMKVKIA